MEAPSPPRAARAALIFFGCCMPLLLAALGIFGLSDLELAAEARIQRDAALRGRSAQSEWEARLGRQAPIAFSEADLTLRPLGLGLGLAPDLGLGLAPAVPLGSEPDLRPFLTQPAELHLLAASADLAAGRRELGLQHLEDAVAADPACAGRALLALTHGLRSHNEGNDLRQLYPEWAERTPHSAHVEGTSARLLGLLSAGQWLEPAAVVAEANEFQEALRAGVAPMLPPVGDRAVWNPAGVSEQADGAGGLTLVLDPWWRAIEDMAETRLGFAGVDWDAVLMKGERRAAAAAQEWLAGVLEGPSALRAGERDAHSNQWTLHPIPDRSAWIALRRLGADEWRATFHTGEELDRALAAGLPEDEHYRVAAFASPEGATPVGHDLPLAGVPVRLSVLAEDPNAILRPVRLRLTMLRAGLLSVAALLAVAAALSWLALRRDARLRGLRSTFVASVSHDLRTPVASIGLLADNMASGFAEGSEDVYIQSLQGETARLRWLIDDLLDFGRIERGLPPRVRRAPVALVDWIETFAAAERERCHRLECSLAVRGAGDTLVFEVTDSGSGLTAAALRADLFRPFERGTAASAGTGLGLSIVRAIAEGHGGSASLRPVDPRRGTPGAVATLTVAMREERSA